MSLTDWAVIAGGIAAIAWVNWYFFIAEGSAAKAAARRRTADRDLGEGRSLT